MHATIRRYESVDQNRESELTKKVTVQLQGASATAIEAVEAAGGSFEKVARVGRPKTSTKNSDK